MNYQWCRTYSMVCIWVHVESGNRVYCHEVTSHYLIKNLFTNDVLWHSLEGTITTLKTKDRQFDNFVVIDGTVSCHYDNLRCHQWRQSCQIDNLSFFSEAIPKMSVVQTCLSDWSYSILALNRPYIKSTTTLKAIEVMKQWQSNYHICQKLIMFSIFSKSYLITWPYFSKIHTKDTP